MLSGIGLKISIFQLHGKKEMPANAEFGLTRNVSKGHKTSILHRESQTILLVFTNLELKDVFQLILKPGLTFTQPVFSW